MHPFVFSRASSLDAALVSAAEGATFVAGGTELLNWMKEGIASPMRLIDINALPLVDIRVDADGLHIGALARMSDVAANTDVRAAFPAIAEALELSASPQLRNMATMGGNLMQRTRCPYFRAEVPLPCNKRIPNTGCAALHGDNRGHAIFGWSERCVATHPSDVAVALAALDAAVVVRSRTGSRTIPLSQFYRDPGDNPAVDTTLGRDELITAITVPRSRVATSSRYIKVRERASYEFALVSAAAAVAMDGDRIAEARIALGGVAHKPWRLHAAEKALAGRPLQRDQIAAAMAAEFASARPLEHNAFKLVLAQRVAARALELAGGRE
jgi:xanthine dehydrogenase YagS FAD-binding subunit